MNLQLQSADLRQTGEAAKGQGLPRLTALIFAVVCGLSVANVYFAHPLLDAIARDFAIAPASVGRIQKMPQAVLRPTIVLVVYILPKQLRVSRFVAYKRDVAFS